LGPRLLGGGHFPVLQIQLTRGYTIHIGHAFLNRTHVKGYGRFWLSSVQSARRVADEKRQKTEEEEEEESR